MFTSPTSYFHDQRSTQNCWEPDYLYCNRETTHCPTLSIDQWWSVESRNEAKLGDTSFWTDFEVQISRGDGHCFMHSVTRFFEELEVTNDITKLYEILKRLEVETVSNIDYYMPFIPGVSKDQLIREMRLYINDTFCDTKFGDIVPLITSKSLAIYIMIISEMENGEFSAVFVHPWEYEKAKAIIFVYKSGDH